MRSRTHRQRQSSARRAARPLAERQPTRTAATETPPRRAASNVDGRRAGAGKTRQRETSGPQINAKAQAAVRRREQGVRAADEGRASSTGRSSTSATSAAADADPNLAEADLQPAASRREAGQDRKRRSPLQRGARSHEPSLQAGGREPRRHRAEPGQRSRGGRRSTRTSSRRSPTTPRAARGWPRSARRKGESDQALELARRGALPRPEDAAGLQDDDARELRAEAVLDGPAVSRCARRKIQENDPEIYFTLGLINMAEKEPAKARVQFKDAVEARPDFLPAHLELAKMALDAGGLRRRRREHSPDPPRQRQERRGAGEPGRRAQGHGPVRQGARGLRRRRRSSTRNCRRSTSTAASSTAARASCREGDRALQGVHQHVGGGDVGLRQITPSSRRSRLQEAVISKREEDKKAAEEAAKMEAEMKKQEDAAKDAREEAEGRGAQEAAGHGARERGEAAEAARRCQGRSLPQATRRRRKKRRSPRRRSGAAEAPAPAPYARRRRDPMNLDDL